MGIQCILDFLLGSEDIVALNRFVLKGTVSVEQLPRLSAYSNP